MPVTKSSAKALRQTKKRTIQNKRKVLNLKVEIKKFKKEKDPKSLPKIYSLVDKLVKTHIVHKNKSKRLKSQLAHLVPKASSSLKSSPAKAAKKKTTKKTS